MRERVELVRKYLCGLWQRVTVTRYARALEEEAARQRAEIARLRAENRALLNSILGIAGIPPIVVTEAEIESARNSDEAAGGKGSAAGDAQRVTGSAGDGRAKVRRGPSTVANGTGQANGVGGRLAGIRRRSWHQINRMLEFESARKPESATPSDTRAPGP
jgi:hypothetical protein